MGKIFFLFFNLIFLSNLLISQIKPENIDIVRDKFGVPHIFAKTDKEVAYGLAWAHAEDDFKTIQIAYLAGNNLLSKYLGNKGLGADFITQFIGSGELFDKKYISDITPEYKIIVKAEKSNINYHVGKIYSINTHSKFQVVMDGHMKTKRFSHIKYGYSVG